ncbi:MAG: hypothetical protein V2I46_00175 [Bacteroides sp.]|jgi:hypothetical protein|nr:hypothetical protein [Bacteroides sp.]
MRQNDHSIKYQQLRAAFPRFVYESCLVKKTAGGVHLVFEFSVNQELVFRPTMFFPNQGRFRVLPDGLLEVLAFHIGMVEMISYWKAFCSPVILIRPFQLDPAKEEWWKKLFRYGLGEFFYTNGIEIPGEEIFEFEYAPEAFPFEKYRLPEQDESVIIPVGGGKDSVVTLQLMKDFGGHHLPLVMNHRGATRQVLEAGGYGLDDSLEIKRTLDPLLLELNTQGFLNGHTPFSALLAFLTTMAAALTGKKYIALSNESSANEPSIPGTKINHQYSKSFEFEQDFRDYLLEHFLEGIHYFSFLRPLNELQIGALFARFPKYHGVFKSCNAGSKTDSWCCNCSKCLFTWTMLDPFLPQEQLLGIFGENLFEKASLAPMLDQLIGVAENKPFECVGTINEVNAALHRSIRKRQGEDLPVLLKHFGEHQPGESSLKGLEDFLTGFHSPHALEVPFVKLLKDALSKIGR